MILNSPADIQSYDDAIRFLNSLDVSVMKLGLDRMRRILATLHNPQDQLPMVHIAGTNGKGSVTAMLASVLKAAGYQVGSFTSPHLIHVRERIAINSNPILPDDFQEEVQSLKAHLEALDWLREEWPTYFEFLNLVAYRCFLNRQMDITLFETGLGGRLDSTNVVRHPNLTVITGIDLEHTHILGDTPEAIAREKAGIIKAESPLVIGTQMSEAARNVILKVAEESNSPVFEADGNAFSFEVDVDQALPLTVIHQPTGTRYRLPLAAPYQRFNVATVLSCVHVLREQGFNISEEAVCEGFAHTHWPARFQMIRQQRLIIDGSHNTQGFASLAEALQAALPDRPLYWMLSLRNTKSADGLAELIRQFPNTRGVFVCQGEPEHLYYDTEALQQLLAGKLPDSPSIQPVTFSGALAALQEKLRNDSEAYGILTGSLYTAGEVLRHV